MPENPTEKAQEVNKNAVVEFTDAEIDAIAKEIFKPESTVVNDAIKFYTGQEKIDSYQRLLLAPANAFESLITFGINVVRGKALEDMVGLIKGVSDEKTRDLLMTTIKKGWENCDRTEQAAFITEFISAILISTAALSRLKNIIPAEKLIILQRSATARRLHNLATVVGNTADDVIPISGKLAKGGMLTE